MKLDHAQLLSDLTNATTAMRVWSCTDSLEVIEKKMGCSSIDFTPKHISYFYSQFAIKFQLNAATFFQIAATFGTSIIILLLQCICKKNRKHIKKALK